MTTDGVLLVGPSGCGKSTAQRELVRSHGFWTPLHITTRQADEDDSMSEQWSPDAFVRGVQTGELVAPMVFANTWHAFRRDEFAALIGGTQRVVVICRPYEALLLHAVRRELVPVWIDLPPDVRARRLAARNGPRDRDAEWTASRRADDEDDLRYRDAFEAVVRGDRIIPAVLALVAPEGLPAGTDRPAPADRDPAATETRSSLRRR